MKKIVVIIFFYLLGVISALIYTNVKVTSGHKTKVMNPMPEDAIAIYNQRNLINRIYLTGDTNVYDSLRIIYYNAAKEYQFYTVALLMANKYDYPLAHQDLYEILMNTIKNTTANNTNYDRFDSETRKNMIYHLNKVREKNN